MANDNNKINELVADDDPTVELEAPAFASGDDVELEEDAQTFSSANETGRVSIAGVTVSELKSDLRARQKTIGKLQFDIEQLHSKWVGLETEISARETQTDQLNNELDATKNAITNKEKLLRKRDRKIKSLKSEIRARNEEFRNLEVQFNQLKSIAADRPPSEFAASSATSLSSGQPDAQNLLRKFSASERYADKLRQNSQDLMKANEDYTREVSALQRLLSDRTEETVSLSDELATVTADTQTLEKRLQDIGVKHENEIRMLRFELGHAQETVVETEDLNSQLTSDLVDARGFKAELERMLSDAEENSADRITQLEKESAKQRRAAENYEQKLKTKSEAISVLLEELAKKSDQIDSIGEIEEVIHDIDERMSERSVKIPATDRVTRMLIGTVDDQVLRFPLFKDRLTIGRTRENDIQLKAAYVSRRHAVIQTDGDSTRIIDWGSKNGIHVNSSGTQEHVLNHGDIVTIGNARFRYEERKMR